MSKALFEEELRGKRATTRKKYAILRTSKIKSFGNLGGSSKHVKRDRETPNADENRTPDNVVLIGSGDPEKDVKNRLKEAGIEKIRKNGVIAVDFVLTASPEYFRPDNPDKAGYWDNEKLEKWKEKTVDFLKQEYGKNMVSAILHLDEATPHIHAYMVPINEKGRLTARDFFGGKEKMIALQDKYHEQVQALGLERGERGSKAKHTSIRQYYSRTNAPGAEAPKYDASLYEGIKPKSMTGLVKESAANSFAEGVAKRVIEKERDWAKKIESRQKEAEAANLKKDAELSQLRPKAAKASDLEKQQNVLSRAISSLPPDIQNMIRQKFQEVQQAPERDQNKGAER